MTLALLLALSAHAATTRPKNPEPLGPYRTWFSTKDYPQDAVIARKQGTTGFEVEIDATGLPSDCRIVSSSGFKSLDDRTCTIMMSRARFRPAKDKRGRPTATVFRHAMVWRLPGRQAQEKTVDRTFDAKSIISATGDVVSCKLTGGGASKIATDTGGCGPFGNKEFFLFFLREDYAKVRSANVRMTINFNGQTPAFERPPNFLKELARSSIDIAPSGKMTGCTTLTKLEQLGHTMDLCDFVRADPPHFPSATIPRKATLRLDLSANYN